MYNTVGKSFKELALDINFWRQLNPELTITEYSRSDWGPYRLSAQQKREVRERLIEEGYFQLHSFFEPDELKRLADAVKVLNRERWPAVFAFVYDEFWHIQNRYRDILNEMVGKEHKMMPNFWVFYINPDDESKGWDPHRDRQKIMNLKPDGTPQSMVFWAPLTDASPLNGCMYILPANRDPHYSTNPYITRADNLQDIRALPAEVGSVLGWNETVFHWGARSSKHATEPRIAISTVFQSTECGAFETPLIPMGQLLPFEMRVALIAQQFDRFTVQHSFSPAVQQLVQDLAPLLGENIHILDDGWHYWNLLKNVPDSRIERPFEKTASNQLPTPPKDFEKGRIFMSTIEEIRAAKESGNVSTGDSLSIHGKNSDGSNFGDNGNRDSNAEGNGNGEPSKSAGKTEAKGWLGRLGLK